MNMFTKNNNTTAPRKRGRPPGPTPQGDIARRRLYNTAIRLFAERGFDETTMRDVATAAGVSPGLLYRYFPSKRAVVVALYDELSREYADRASRMPAGRWRDRFAFALDASLEVLKPHRRTIAALVPALLHPDEGLFAPSTASSRERITSAFDAAVSGASDAPARALAAALGRLLYLAHMGVVLWWLLDRSARQRTTSALVNLIRKALPSAALLLRLPWVRTAAIEAAELVKEGLMPRDRAAAAAD